MPEENAPKRLAPTKKERPHLLGYLVVLFAAAFLLLLMSYFMQQRRSDQVIDGLQQNMSAMQTTQNVIERNRTLTEENQSLRDQNGTLSDQNEQLEEQNERQEKTILALDWLWRIEREYFQGRYSSARSMIQEMEQANLDDFLPETSPSDPEYRSPADQYKSIYNILF